VIFVDERFELLQPLRDLLANVVGYWHVPVLLTDIRKYQVTAPRDTFAPVRIRVTVGDQATSDADHHHQVAPIKAQA
jgi:hypothetical protein